MVGVFFISSTYIGITWLQRISLSPVTLTNYNKRWRRKKKNRFLRQINSSRYLKLCTTWSGSKHEIADKKERSRACVIFFSQSASTLFAHLMISYFFSFFDYYKMNNWQRLVLDYVVLYSYFINANFPQSDLNIFFFVYVALFLQLSKIIKKKSFWSLFLLTKKNFVEHEQLINFGSFGKSALLSFKVVVARNKK